MSENNENLLEQLNTSNKDMHNLRQIISSLSLLVILIVFWSLKLTGIGIAGEAFCGKEEHIHTEECVECIKEEHTHTTICYSDINADLETSDDWEASLADIARGPTLKSNIILVAQSQLGYKESELNFQVDENDVRRGITRYGQWYGNPYGDWSAMFVSFCLEYAGGTDFPIHSGAETMRLAWEEKNIYKTANKTSPQEGNIVFLHKGETANKTATAVAIITKVDKSRITVIEGDLNDTVAEAQYDIDDAIILGYGIIEEPKNIMLANAPSLLAVNYTVWLDGTDGGLEHLTGSPNTSYTVEGGNSIKLPSEWSSPSKYSYKLRGWYDITNSKYYQPGAEIIVNGNTVLYADWVASTYDIGKFNSQVTDTVSTNNFITTHVFDYNYLFNVQSLNPKITVDSKSHSETWSMVSSGKVNYKNAATLDFMFGDSDGSGALSNPNNRSNHNLYHEADTITSNIYTSQIGDLLYSTDNAYDPETGKGVIGKTYLGTGDHLFQLITDPSNEHYGYYYYDSLHNASSYNQSDGRFYVYEYLSATSDSIDNDISADFIPLNSPYANTNNQTVGNYKHPGVNNKYDGVTHYRYETKYSDGGNLNTEKGVSTDFAYGVRSDIHFYLPNEPGSGNNKDVHGNPMKFQFSGDDDLWVLIDDILVLDIGGIHQRIGGEINFATGAVTLKGASAPSLMDLGITSGEHTLTMLYLERGASMSNCSIYFNLSPRFSLEIEKEDFLTHNMLDGTTFSIYKDYECTVPAQLWESESDYEKDRTDGVFDQYKNTFTVTDGIAKLWGLGCDCTYYIKETKPPDAHGYGFTSGIIRLKVEKSELETYFVDVLPDAEGNEPSEGFTVHGVNIDEETKKMYITVTNAPESVEETTSVQVIKKWNDNLDHSGEYIKAYLTITDADGSFNRIQEIALSEENNWTHTWTNLPKYNYNTSIEVQYGVEENYQEGYYSTYQKITEIVTSKTEWKETLTFENGQTYILKTANGYLSTLDNKADTGYQWVDEATAKTSQLALWTTTVSGSTVKFTNKIGQTITFYYNGGSPTDFFATSDSPNQQSRQDFTCTTRSNGVQIAYKQGATNYYLISTMTSSKKFNYSTNANNSLLFTPFKLSTVENVQQVKNWAYEITNTPLGISNETSLSVSKNWVIPEGYESKVYEEFSITIRLYANGVSTGRNLTLDLSNNWQGVFQGLPYKDSNDKIIEYTVDELWAKPRWTTTYGEIQTINGSPPAYSTVVTNTYHPGGPPLPSTGSPARLMFTLCGFSIILGTLVYGIGLRRKRERRAE